MNNLIKKSVKKPYLVLPYCLQKCSKLIKSDKLYLKLYYRLAIGKKLDLEHPKTFTAKLQWLKLHNTSTLCTQLVDKYRVREFVKEKLGEEYLIPLLGVWEHFDDIDFDALPNQFVLKTNHGSGGVVICKEKRKLDKEEAKKGLEKSLKENYFWASREYPYKNVPPRIIAEKFMQDENGNPPADYKFFCFNGEPMILFNASDRFKTKGVPAKYDYYDMELNHLPFGTKGHGHTTMPLQFFPEFEQMKSIARQLSEGFPHVRVDLYLIGGKIYFGEITFHHGGGFEVFEPQEWDLKLGEMIKLPIDE